MGKAKKIDCIILEKGGDSAVFNINKDGRVLMLSTSLKLKQDALSKSCSGQGVIIDQRESTKVVEEQKKHHEFFKDKKPTQMMKLSEPHELVTHSGIAFGA